MRRLLVATATATLLAAGAPTASAHPDYHYDGGCTTAVVNDTTPGALLGGPTVWNGIMIAAVLSTRDNGLPAPLAPISVECWIRINGVPTLWGPIASGTGAAAGALIYSFVADPWDVVDVCEGVTVNGEFHTSCASATVTKTVPQPVVDLVDDVLRQLDPILCVILGTLAPGIPGVVDVGPDGDVILSGDPIYDCPPYGGGGNVDRRVPYLMTDA